jgi:hypothetical protein
MAAPKADATTRYINPGTTVVLLVDTIADITNPTRAELDAGLDVSEQVGEATGWLVSGAAVDMPDLAKVFTGNLPGRTSAEQSSLSFYADKTGADLREKSVRGAETNVVWMDGGDVPGYLCDIFPVRVLSQGLTRSVAGDAAATLPVQYAITSQPAQNVVIPS